MSVAIPVVDVVFGSVTPPQGDILELRIHLGCTKEVSSFDCLLQNFDKKYSTGETNAINVGDDSSISIGRGSNCPLIFTGRVEDVELESTSAENYIRVRGRCSGEKIFRRVVTKTYETQKGEAIVKDLLDNYIDLSHVRDSVELVEDTDTTYTLLEYENSPVFDILKYIAESADKDGVIGFDFRVEWDGKFAFFPKDSKTSPITLAEKIEVSRYSKDIHRIRNKIMVYGAAEKPYPLDVDGQSWSDSLTEDLTKTDNILEHSLGDWKPGTGSTTLNKVTQTEELAGPVAGTYFIEVNASAYMYYTSIYFEFDTPLSGNNYPKLSFALYPDGNHDVHRSGWVALHDSTGKTATKGFHFQNINEWEQHDFSLGKKNEGAWNVEEGFDWDNIKKIFIAVNQDESQYGEWYLDKFFLTGMRWSAPEEDSGSQTAYGLRELVEVDEELHSDNECDLRAKALLDHLSQPAEFLTLRTTCLDYGTNHLLSGDKIHVTLPNDNVDSDFRIISVEYRVIAGEQTLEITLELGREKPLLADYLYGLRATTITVEKLMRTKAGA